MGFNPDGNPLAEQDARAWAREIAKTNRILTWDYSLTEGENSILPHFRFDRLFQRRKEERARRPTAGDRIYHDPLLSQLSLFESARSFVDPNGDYQLIAGEFCELLFGQPGRGLAHYLPLFEVIPDWGTIPS